MTQLPRLYVKPLTAVKMFQEIESHTTPYSKKPHEAKQLYNGKEVISSSYFGDFSVSRNARLLKLRAFYIIAYSQRLRPDYPFICV